MLETHLARAHRQRHRVVLGGFEGITPGGGGTVAAFLAYNEASRWSKDPEEFGKGSEEGVSPPGDRQQRRRLLRR